jgi:hypothetical protein
LALACQPGPPSPVYTTGEFRVTGAGAVTHANIYYRAFGGAGDNVLYNVALPWSLSFAIVQTGDEYFLAAQSNDNTTVPADTLTIEVLVEAGTIATKSISNVPFGYVALYGTAP